MGRPLQDNNRLTYSEILRVLGKYIDRSDLAEIRVVEVEGGIILQGLIMKGEHAGERETYQLTMEDVGTLLLDAYAQRGRRV